MLHVEVVLESFEKYGYSEGICHFKYNPEGIYFVLYFGLNFTYQFLS